MRRFALLVILLLVMPLTLVEARSVHETHVEDMFPGEKFEDKLDYSINNRIGGKKAIIYNIEKITELPNNIGNALKFNGSSKTF